jgi:hypothetical protein
MLNKTLFVIIIFSLSLCIKVDNTIANNNSIREYEAKDYILSIGYEELEDDYNLVLSIKSKMHDPVSMYKFKLPWGNRYSMIIIPTYPHGQIFEILYYIDDPRFDVITLKYEETFSGKISLKHYFPKIIDVLKRTDVIIFWSYKLDLLSDKSTERLGGCLILPRKKMDDVLEK